MMEARVWTGSARPAVAMLLRTLLIVAVSGRAPITSPERFLPTAGDTISVRSGAVDSGSTPTTTGTRMGLTFTRPAKIYPTDNSTSRTFGGVYADAFYAVTVSGESDALFGTPGVTGAATLAQLSTDGGTTWTPWYSSEYVSKTTG